MTRSFIICIVDDDEPVRDALSMALEAVGYRTETFVDGDDFLTRGRIGCDFVISDVRMPGTNGIELTRMLRMGGAKFPIILITGHADAALSTEAMNVGADVLLSKPLKLLEILAEIAQAAAFHDLQQ